MFTYNLTMDHDTRVKGLGGGAVAAAMISGTAAVILAVISVTAGRFEAAGIALLASSVAFVGVANVIFRR